MDSCMSREVNRVLQQRIKISIAVSAESGRDLSVGSTNTCGVCDQFMDTAVPGRGYVRMEECSISTNIANNCRSKLFPDCSKFDPGPLYFTWASYYSNSFTAQFCYDLNTRFDPSRLLQFITWYCTTVTVQHSSSRYKLELFDWMEDKSVLLPLEVGHVDLFTPYWYCTFSKK